MVHSGTFIIEDDNKDAYTALLELYDVMLSQKLIDPNMTREKFNGKVIICGINAFCSDIINIRK